MIINIWAVLICAVVSMVIGFVWYGPMFGKAWMRICGAKFNSPEEIQKAQKAAMPLYALQFILVILQVLILQGFTYGLPFSFALHNTLLAYFGFVMPTVAASAMYNGNANKMKWLQFWIQAGYYLVLFIIFAAILSAF